MTQDQERAKVVAVARCWVATPYHHRAHVLGGGVDCAQLLNQAFAGAGLIDEVDLGNYSIDWHCHRNEEKYLAVVAHYCQRVDDGSDRSLNDRAGFLAQPGDILVFRHGRTFSHGAIVSQWPYIIHAYFRARMVEEVSIYGTEMATKPLRVYSFWGTPE